MSFKTLERKRAWEKQYRIKHKERITKRERELYALNREERCEYSRQWGLENREKQREASRRCYYKNLEKIRERGNNRQKKDRRLNPEKYRLRDRKWRENNPQRAKLNDKAKRACYRRYGKADIKVIQLVYEDNIKRFGTLTCYLCLESTVFGQDSLEHKIPLSQGGTHEYNNLAVACRKCNSSKGNKTKEEWEEKRSKWI